MVLGSVLNAWKLALSHLHSPLTTFLKISGERFCINSACHKICNHGLSMVIIFSVVSVNWEKNKTYKFQEFIQLKRMESLIDGFWDNL